MAVLVGKKAPNFSAAAVINGGEIVRDFSLEQFVGNKYVVFFFYPKDFSGLCPSELIAFQAQLSAFQERDCELIACSTDTQETHKAWLNTEVEQGGIKGVSYPIVADTNKTISDAYDVLLGEYQYSEMGELIATDMMIAKRGLFIINKEGVVRYQVVNDLPVGRSVHETLRMVDAIQFNETKGKICPADFSKEAVK
jgi:peroxiredoxin 2/4